MILSNSLKFAKFFEPAVDDFPSHHGDPLQLAVTEVTSYAKNNDKFVTYFYILQWILKVT